MRIERNENGIISGFICDVCNSYNDILEFHCWNCKTHRSCELDLTAITIKFKRQSEYEELKIMPDTDRIELHTKFYNHEKPLYAAMSLEQKRAHRDEIALILLEGRARMNAIDDADREERALKGPKGKEWLTTNQDELGSDAIEQPKIRKERMTKADKLAADMANLGLSKEEINKMLGQVAQVQSGGSVTTSTTREVKSPTYSFTKENPVNNTKESLLADLSQSLTDGIKDRPIEHLVEAAVTAGHLANKILGPIGDVKEESKVFNPSSLFGAK